MGAVSLGRGIAHAERSPQSFPGGSRKDRVTYNEAKPRQSLMGACHSYPWGPIGSKASARDLQAHPRGQQQELNQILCEVAKIPANEAG